MKTLQELATRLKIDESALLRLADVAPFSYTARKEPKRSGGFRLIEAPHSELKKLQRSLLDEVLHSLPFHPMLYGGPGSSTRDAAIPHRRQPLVLAFDIKDFFPSVTVRHVKRALGSHGFSAEVSSIVTRLVTREKRLPQGAPTSPAIARLVLNPLCNELQKMLLNIHHEARASIYVDDLTISGPEGLLRLKGLIVKMFKRHGFTIHPKKVRAMPRSVTQEVLGISVNEQLTPGPSFSTKLDKARKTLAVDDPSLKGMESYANWVKG